MNVPHPPYGNLGLRQLGMGEKRPCCKMLLNTVEKPSRHTGKAL